MGTRFTLRRTITALAMGAAAAASLVLVAPVANAAPQVKTMRLLDQCDKPSWDVGFPGLCTVSAGSVTLERFRADLAKGGNNNWWINNRNETINSGDSLQVLNQGGIVHSFTEVQAYGQGIVPEWNTAIKETGQAITVNGLPVLQDPAAFTTFVPSGTSKDVVPTKGVHKYQCIIHPWMRTVVTVQ